MIMKTKSKAPIQLIRNASNVAAWQVPELAKNGAPGFQQPPIDEEPEEEKTVAEQVSQEEQLAQAFEQARQEGFQSGHEEGLKLGQTELATKLNILDTLIKQLLKPVKACEEQTQAQLVQLAFAIARQIVRRELQQDPTQLIALVREALKLLPAGVTEIKIAMHPEDAQAVKAALSIGDSDSIEQSGGWQIHGDPSIAQGGCVVKTKNSEIDASVDKQIAMLYSRMLGGQRAGEDKQSPKNHPNATQSKVVSSPDGDSASENKSQAEFSAPESSNTNQPDSDLPKSTASLSDAKQDYVSDPDSTNTNQQNQTPPKLE